MKPYVILHIGTSLDGRIDWGLGADNPYYECIEQFNSDIDLSGSNTILRANFPENPEKDLGDLYAMWVSKPDKPRLAVVDSKGQIKNWETIRKQPFWRGFISLCSEETPQSHLDYLKRTGIETVIAGKDHVDLRTALEDLNRRFDTQRMRVDSGGVLNGVLLREGLVDEVSVIISPSLVGGESPKTLFVAPDLDREDDVVRLKLDHIETIRDRYVWLRYRVEGHPG